MTALTASEVQTLQNSTPTDWSRFDADMTQRSSGDSNRFKDDSKLHVRFYTAPMIDVEESTKANRAVFRQVEMVEIMMPGEKNNIIRDMVWDQHRSRFPEKYAAFKAGQSQEIGSPLTVLPFLNEARIMELAYVNIKTVEQLASVADSVKQKFMGLDRLSQQAQEWLAKFNSTETLRTAMAEAEAKKDEQIAALHKQLADLTALVQKQTSPQQQGNQRR